MRVFPALLLAALLLAAACQPEPDTEPVAAPSDTAAAPAALDTVTVTGVLIDATCHTRDISPSECEGQYVAEGYPVGLRSQASEAPVWILVMVPQAVGDYLTRTARVTGVVRSEGVLIPHRMEVKNGDVWTAVM